MKVQWLVPIALALVGCGAPSDPTLAAGAPPRTGDFLSSSSTGQSAWRVKDWSSSRVTGRGPLLLDPSTPASVRMQEIARARGVPSWWLSKSEVSATPNSRAIDWNIGTGSPVTSTPAILGGFTAQSATDAIYFAVSGAGGGSNGIISNVANLSQATTTLKQGSLFKLVNIYQTTPTVAWVAKITTYGVDAPVALSTDGTKVYVVDTSGTLRCYQATVAGENSSATSAPSNAAGCSGWTNFSSGSAVHGSAPWVDYVSGDVYFGNDSGVLSKVDGTTGAKIWQVTLVITSSGQKAQPIRVGPVVYDGAIYVGDDNGWLFRVKDGSSTPNNASTDVASYVTCGKSYCGSGPTTAATQWAIRSAISIDTTFGEVYASAGGELFEFPIGLSGNWQPTSASPKILDSTSGNTDYSGPALDVTNGYIYDAYASKLYKVAYPFTGSQTSGIYSATLQKSGSPIGMPLAYSGNIYVGDPGGITEEYGCATSALSPALAGTTGSAYGTSINTVPVVDWASGDVSFGYTASGGGGLVQFPMGSANFSCPSGTKSCSGSCSGAVCLGCCTSADCGSGQACVGGACVTGCSTNAQCQALANVRKLRTSCSAPSCSAVCKAGFGDCNADLQNVSGDGCETATATDANNCGGCGTACSTSHIATPTCSSSSCDGTCDFGYADCNADKQSDGCESTATCGNCCGAVCGTGQVCWNSVCTTLSPTDQQADLIECGLNSEHQTVTLTCPSGQTITSIPFAQFGTPGGTCGSFTVGACADNVAADPYVTACIGKNSCSLIAENGNFASGDPCVGTFKRLYVQVQCSTCP